MGLAASRQEAFWEACGFGNVERAKHFLQEGDIDVNWVSYTNDCCPIHVASQGKPEIVQLLLDHKCDVNVRDNRGNLPIHHAAMKGHTTIVQMLINAGSEINAQEKNGWTALHNAAYWCQSEVVKLLVKNGCDVHKQNKDERTALHECARSQCREELHLGEIARTLIEAGCDINSKSSDWGEADLTGLMYTAYHNHPDVAAALIEAGCELDAVGTTFWTALHWAADRGNDELVYMLLEAGINPTIRDMRGETAYDRAKSDQMREVLKTAIDLHKELNAMKVTPILQVLKSTPKTADSFKPKCDVNFKSQSLLPKDWKTSNSLNVKNLINEKKSKLAAMTSEKYRSELARRTGTAMIKDEDVKTAETEEKKDFQKDSFVETDTSDSFSKGAENISLCSETEVTADDQIESFHIDAAEFGSTVEKSDISSDETCKMETEVEYVKTDDVYMIEHVHGNTEELGSTLVKLKEANHVSSVEIVKTDCDIVITDIRESEQASGKNLKDCDRDHALKEIVGDFKVELETMKDERKYSEDTICEGHKVGCGSTCEGNEKVGFDKDIAKQLVTETGDNEALQ
ncbi:putative ankyrin repeat protein RF_0381 [Dreissena polymorpha]|nr:putative ankyrin repeat protein RF_0381 [Dreissena polymorpha]